MFCGQVMEYPDEDRHVGSKVLCVITGICDVAANEGSELAKSVLRILDVCRVVVDSKVAVRVERFCVVPPPTSNIEDDAV